MLLPGETGGSVDMREVPSEDKDLFAAHATGLMSLSEDVLGVLSLACFLRDP